MVAHIRTYVYLLFKRQYFYLTVLRSSLSSSTEVMEDMHTVRLGVHHKMTIDLRFRERDMVAHIRTYVCLLFKRQYFYLTVLRSSLSSSTEVMEDMHTVRLGEDSGRAMRQQRAYARGTFGPEMQTLGSEHHQNATHGAHSHKRNRVRVLRRVTFKS
ncbi:PREDICTED: uncharacterized protein LOC105571215 [Vollenhovia emeryi]|uniref:uncharacterized protein LOC105571215 n=1 Tax=Vollenhovia emeryi TaxID=411798 RepID=UPI0005F3D743|nr:PREDICTED: uncharacterized protein LOC105571215 [Vollenhovia emeryi]